MNASAASAGFYVGLQILVAQVPRGRTIASSPTTRNTQALFLSRPVERSSGTFKAGLYELVSSSSGAGLYSYDSVGSRIQVQPLPPAPSRTPLGDDLCGDAPGSLHDFCQSLVACWAYDLWCY